MSKWHLYKCDSALGTSCSNFYDSGELDPAGPMFLGGWAGFSTSAVKDIRYLKVKTENSASYYSGMGEVQVFEGALPPMPWLHAIPATAGVTLGWSGVDSSCTRLRIVRAESKDGVSYGINYGAWAHPGSPAAADAIVVLDTTQFSASGSVDDTEAVTGTVYAYSAWCLSSVGWSVPDWRGMAAATAGDPKVTKPNLFQLQKAVWLGRPPSKVKCAWRVHTDMQCTATCNL